MEVIPDAEKAVAQKRTAKKSKRGAVIQITAVKAAGASGGGAPEGENVCELRCFARLRLGAVERVRPYGAQSDVARLNSRRSTCSQGAASTEVRGVPPGPRCRSVISEAFTPSRSQPLIGLSGNNGCVPGRRATPTTRSPTADRRDSRTDPSIRAFFEQTREMINRNVKCGLEIAPAILWCLLAFGWCQSTLKARPSFL